MRLIKVFILFFIGINSYANAPAAVSTVFIQKTNNFFSKVSKSSQKKLVILDFWATWCTPCKAMIPIIEKVSNKYKDKIILIKINVDDFKAFIKYIGVKAVPNLWVFSKGKITKFSKKFSETEFEKTILDIHKNSI